MVCSFFPLLRSLKCFGLGFAISVGSLDIYNMFSLAQYENYKGKKTFSFRNVLFFIIIIYSGDTILNPFDVVALNPTRSRTHAYTQCQIKFKAVRRTPVTIRVTEVPPSCSYSGCISLKLFIRN